MKAKGPPVNVTEYVEEACPPLESRAGSKVLRSRKRDLPRISEMREVAEMRTLRFLSLDLVFFSLPDIMIHY